MRSGRLRFRITLQETSVTRGEYNEEVITWSDVATVWADVQPLRGREFIEAQQEGAEIDVRFVIRYRDGLSPEMRIQYDSRTYDVVHINHVGERQREMEILARRIYGQEMGA